MIDSMEDYDEKEICGIYFPFYAFLFAHRNLFYRRRHFCRQSYALIISLGTGIGMGAAVTVSLNTGAGNTEKAKKAEGNAFLLLFAGALLLTFTLYLFGTPLLELLGAKGELLPLAEAYLKYILLGSIVQTFASGMVPLMRNHGASFYAMCAMALGCVSNILLDYLLVMVLNL